MHLDIYSDVVCPWCLIGKRRLERALTETPRDGLVVRWRPFQLNPDLPAEGIDRKEYLRLKFGDRADDFYARIGAVAEGEGIDIAYDRIERQPNTLMAHRLIDLAWRHGRQDAVVEGLFAAYFQEGVFVGDVDRLVEIAAAAGLEADAVRDYLAGDEDVERIRREDAHARTMGITGVPFFILDSRLALSGAQTPEVFHQFFAHGAEQDAAAGAHS